MSEEKFTEAEQFGIAVGKAAKALMEDNDINLYKIKVYNTMKEIAKSLNEEFEYKGLINKFNPNKIIFKILYENPGEEDLYSDLYVYDGENLYTMANEDENNIEPFFIINAKDMGENPDIKSVADKLLYIVRNDLEKYINKGDIEDGRNQK